MNKYINDDNGLEKNLDSDNLDDFDIDKDDEKIKEVEFVFDELGDDINDDIEVDNIIYKDDIDDKYVPNLLTKDEREKYANENIKIVYAVAKQYLSENHTIEELSSVGNKGFTKALNKFDKNRNVKFSTYAWTCVTFDILHYLRKENKHINNKVSINNVLNVDESGNEMELGDILRDIDYGATTNDEKVILSEAVKFMNQIIDDLPYNEKYILVYRYGLNGNKIKTQEEIANEIGMSQANVSKLEQTIVYKLKMLLGSKYKLRDLNDI